MKACGTSWTTQSSCGQEVWTAFEGLRAESRCTYDANTSTATTTGERREARRRGKDVREAQAERRNEVADAKFDAVPAGANRREHAQIDSRAPRSRVRQLTRLRCMCACRANRGRSCFDKLRMTSGNFDRRCGLREMLRIVVENEQFLWTSGVRCGLPLARMTAAQLRCEHVEGNDDGRATRSSPARDANAERSASDGSYSTTADRIQRPPGRRIPSEDTRRSILVQTEAVQGNPRGFVAFPRSGAEISRRTPCAGARGGVRSVHAGFVPAGEQRGARRRRHAADTKYDAVLAEMIGEDTRRSVSRAIEAVRHTPRGFVAHSRATARSTP